MKMKNNRVFFIVSNHSKRDSEIKYSIENKGTVSLKKEFQKTIKYKKEDFTVNVFSFEISLKDFRKDNKSKRYMACSLLEYRKIRFRGKILFNENRNNFIYDFKFEEYDGWTGKSYPPPFITFSKNEQLKIYEEMLKNLNVESDDTLNENLDEESYCHLINQKYYFDFYLEILKHCYERNMMKKLLIF